MSTLGHRVAKSAAWMIGARLALRGIGLVSTVFLARLLRPEDFGLVALAMALVGTMETLGNFSFDLALIREGGATREHYDTVWTLTIIRGAAVAAGLAALARPAASFFGDPRVEPIVYCFAATTFLDGLQNVGIVDFRKELRFDREFSFQVLAKLAAFATTLTLAFLWREYWALVLGIAVGKLASVVLSFTMHPYRPRISLSQWRGLIGFSKWLLASNISYFLSGRLDTFVVGRVAGAHALGLYEISSEISSLPTGELISPIQRALYPGYAKLIKDRTRLSATYISGLAIMAMIAMPAAVGIASTARLIVEVFLGEKWLEAVALLQVLAIAGILKVGYANVGPVLLTLGKASLLSHLSLANLILLAVLVIGATIAAGPIGTAYGVAATAGIMLIIYVAATLHVLLIRVRMLVRAIWRTLAAVAVMGLAVHALSEVWPDDLYRSAAMELTAAIAVGAITYIGAHLTIWRLAGSPQGAEKDVLAAVTPLARRWSTSSATPLAIGEQTIDPSERPRMEKRHSEDNRDRRLG
jgi:lipopolysaccharide exporter